MSHAADIIAKDPAYKAAMNAGKIAGDAHMREAGRSEWNDEDYRVAAAVRDSLDPLLAS